MMKRFALCFLVSLSLSCFVSAQEKWGIRKVSFDLKKKSGKCIFYFKEKPDFFLIGKVKPSLYMAMNMPFKTETVTTYPESKTIVLSFTFAKEVTEAKGTFVPTIQKDGGSIMFRPIGVLTPEKEAFIKFFGKEFILLAHGKLHGRELKFSSNVNKRGIVTISLQAAPEKP